MVDKKRYPKNPLRNPTQKELRERFEDLEVANGYRLITAFPTAEDFKEASRCDPTDCGFVHTLARACGATKAVVFVTHTYVDHVGPDGVRRLYKYKNSSHVQRVIRDYDVGKKVDVSKPFCFLPPAKKARIEEQRKKGRRLRRSPNGRAILQEWMARDKLKRAEADKIKLENRLENLEVRYSPQSPSVIETRASLANVRQRIRVLREDFDTLHAEANEVRKRPYTPKHTEGKLGHLDIRHGTGRMSFGLAVAS